MPSIEVASFHFVASHPQERAGALFDAADVDKSGTVDFEARHKSVCDVIKRCKETNGDKMP